MLTKASLNRIVFVFALAASAGCAKGSDTAASAGAGDSVLLLEAGADPKSPVRYDIATGTTSASTMDFRIATLAESTEGASLTVVPGVRLNILAGPTMDAKDGTRYDVRVVKAEALLPDGVSEDEAFHLNQGVSVLNNLGGTVSVDDRGQVIESEFNSRTKRPDVPARLLVMLVNARTSLARISLPAEPIGLGARWEVRKELILYGFKISQVDTYTLVDRIGDELRLNVNIQQTALPQSVTFPQDGVEIAVESFRMSAQGDAIANLHALTTQAVATGDSIGRLVVTTVDGAEPIQVERRIEMRIAPSEGQ